MWCCMQLSGSEGPCFLLHVMPVAPDSSSEPSKKHKSMVSRAGDGPGLQVFPGSVTKVDQVRTYAAYRCACIGNFWWHRLGNMTI